MYGLRYKHIRIEDQQLIFEMDKMIEIDLIYILNLSKLKNIIMKKGGTSPLEIKYR